MFISESHYFFFLFSIIVLFLFYIIEFILYGIAIDERVWMMWKRHSYGVPNGLSDNTNILCEWASDATLRLRYRFMRKCNMPRDVPEFAINASSKKKIQFVFKISHVAITI